MAQIVWTLCWPWSFLFVYLLHWELLQCFWVQLWVVQCLLPLDFEKLSILQNWTNFFGFPQFSRTTPYHDSIAACWSFRTWFQNKFIVRFCVGQIFRIQTVGTKGNQKDCWLLVFWHSAGQDGADSRENLRVHKQCWTLTFIFWTQQMQIVSRSCVEEETEQSKADRRCVQSAFFVRK